MAALDGFSTTSNGGGSADSASDGITFFTTGAGAGSAFTGSGGNLAKGSTSISFSFCSSGSTDANFLPFDFLLLLLALDTFAEVAGLDETFFTTEDFAFEPDSSSLNA
ncbi:hypothetical protein D3C87_1561650 [compost metagenome]